MRSFLKKLLFIFIFYLLLEGGLFAKNDFGRKANKFSKNKQSKAQDLSNEQRQILQDKLKIQANKGTYNKILGRIVFVEEDYVIFEKSISVRSINSGLFYACDAFFNPVAILSIEKYNYGKFFSAKVQEGSCEISDIIIAYEEAKFKEFSEN